MEARIAKRDGAARKQDCAQIFLVKGAEDFIRILTEMQSRKQSKPLPQLLTRLEPFVAMMRLFFTTISIFVSSDPMIAALIWGSFKVLIEVCASLSLRRIERLSN